MEKTCRACQYYEGKLVPTTADNSLREQCGKKYCDNRHIMMEVKYGTPNSKVICATSSNFRFHMNALVGEYNSFKSIQLTKKEFDSFEQWKDNEEIIEDLSTRKLGCVKCRNAQYGLSREEDMDLLETNVKMQADLWKCKYCGAYWEYGVYRNIIVDESYVINFYHYLES